MLKVNRQHMKLELIQPQKLADAGYRECEDIQELIARNPDAFFKEIGETFLLVGKEVQARKPLGDSIDLLAIDQEGKAVIFELKRGKDKLQLLQSITYAAMVSKWRPEQFYETRARFKQATTEVVSEEIESFLAKFVGNLNNAQRIILIAEEFDPAVVTSAEWLTDQYELEIQCYRLKLSKDGATEFLSCSREYPPIELMASRPGAASPAATSNWPNWDTALADISNKAVRDFFASQLPTQENRLRYRDLIWRIGNDRRFYVSGRKEYAYVWQTRRFKGDVEFWQTKLPPDADVLAVNNERALQFYLRNDQACQAFLKAVTSDLVNVQFVGPEESPPSDSEAGPSVTEQ